MNKTAVAINVLEIVRRNTLSRITLVVLAVIVILATPTTALARTTGEHVMSKAPRSGYVPI